MRPSPIDKPVCHSRRHLAKALGVIATAGVATLATTRLAHALPPPPCFLPGTLIRTPNGERAIEQLRIGDIISTRDGERPIQWIARNRYQRHPASKAWVRDLAPILIRAGAIDDDVPRRDLYVSSGHAMLVGDVLVAAGSLENGVSVLRLEHFNLDTLDYYNLKLERHGVIFAEGAPCESMLYVRDHVTNFAEFARMYGEPTYDEAPCLPRTAYEGGWQELYGHLRSALSPFADFRHDVDIARDRIDFRALAQNA